MAEVGPLTYPEALLCDRDGTIVVDVPYNDDPERVELLPGVAAALARARRHGLRLGLVTNQSGVAKGLIAPERLAAVNARLEALVGPFDVVLACPHDDSDGCACRKPAPGMVLSAADALGVEASACVVVGDTWSDVDAAHRAGAVGILVGTDRASAAAVKDTAIVRRDLADAVDLILSWRSR